MIGPLVKAGANPNFCNGSTLTPLRYAVDRGNADMIGLLVEAGADPNLYASGWTPLKYAVNQGKRDMIGPLVEAGADPNLVDPLRGTPIGNLCNEFKPSGLEDLEEKLALASELRASGARAVGAKEELCLAINYLRQERPKYARALLKVLLSGENSIVPEEFRRLKMLAHAFHLDGIGHVDSSVSAEEANESFTGKLEGSWSEGWYREMEKRTRELARTFGSTDAAEPMRELAHFLSRGAEQAALGREGIAKRVLAGKPCVITTGFVGHAVSALLFGDNLVICNRGGESRKPVEVYKMANVTKASILELLDQLERCKHEQRHGYIHFLKGLSHRFDSSEKNSTAKAIEDACELPHQWVGNCSWASAEASVWAFMALKAVGNEEVETKPMEERLAGVKEDFGAWIAYQRIRTIREYLEVVEERGSTPDHGVLRRAFATAWVMVPAADAGLRSVLEDAEAQYLRVLERTDSRRCVEFKSEKLYWSNVLGSWSPAKVMYRPLKPLPEFARSKLEARLHPLWRKVFSWHEGPPPAE